MSSTDKLIDFATKNIQDAINASEKFLPTATKYVLQITQLNCLMNLLPLVYLIPVLITLGTILYRTGKWWYKKNNFYDEWPIPVFIFGGIGLAVTLVATVVLLSDGWNWVCIFRPDLYLVHLAVQKVLGQ